MEQVKHEKHFFNDLNKWFSLVAFLKVCAWITLLFCLSFCWCSSLLNRTRKVIVMFAALSGCEHPQTASTYCGCCAWTALNLQPVCRLLAGKMSLSLSISTLPVYSISANAKRNRLDYKTAHADNYSLLVLGNETRRRQNGSLSSLAIKTTTRRLHYLFSSETAAEVTWPH